MLGVITIVLTIGTICTEQHSEVVYISNCNPRSKQDICTFHFRSAEYCNVASELISASPGEDVYQVVNNITWYKTIFFNQCGRSRQCDAVLTGTVGGLGIPLGFCIDVCVFRCITYIVRKRQRTLRNRILSSIPPPIETVIHVNTAYIAGPARTQSAAAALAPYAAQSVAELAVLKKQTCPITQELLETYDTLYVSHCGHVGSPSVCELAQCPLCRADGVRWVAVPGAKDTRARYITNEGVPT